MKNLTRATIAATKLIDRLSSIAILSAVLTKLSFTIDGSPFIWGVLANSCPPAVYVSFSNNYLFHRHLLILKSSSFILDASRFLPGPFPQVALILMHKLNASTSSIVSRVFSRGVAGAALVAKG